MNAEGRLWWYANSNGGGTFKTWLDGVTVDVGDVTPEDRFLLGPDSVLYFSTDSGPFDGCDPRNDSLVERLDLSDFANVGSSELMAGGAQGFVDSSFGSPFGSLCGDGHAMAWGAGGRLYVRDEGNNAVRYLVMDW